MWTGCFFKAECGPLDRRLPGVIRARADARFGAAAARLLAALLFVAGSAGTSFGASDQRAPRASQPQVTQPQVNQPQVNKPQVTQDAPLEEPEAAPDLDEMLDNPPDDSKKVFSSDLEIELKQQTVATLFELLEAAADSGAAKPIEQELLRRFHTSGSETVDLLLQRALLAIRDKQNAVALDLINAITILKPDFAEGWNKRAHLNFAAGDLGKSIADLEKVLSLEPRHFGALNGLAIILERVDRDAEALEVYDELLKIHPFLEDAEKARDELRTKLGGRGA